MAILFGGAEPFGQFWQEHLCEIILNFGQQFRCHLMIFLFFSSGGHDLVWWSRTIGQFWKRALWATLYELILNLDQWLRRRYRVREKFMNTDHNCSPSAIGPGELIKG